MSGKKIFTEEELSSQKEIRETYNNGNAKKAYELAQKFFNKKTNSVLAIYNYAVMAGDYALVDIDMSNEKKEELTNIAKKYTEELYNLKDLDQYNNDFISCIKNEYYWFHKLHSKQYELGVEDN